MPVDKNSFENIRPYDDHEVKPVISRLVQDKEFLQTLISFRYSACPKFLEPLLCPIISWYLRRRVKNISTIHDLQIMIESYVQKMLDDTTEDLSVSGLEHLDPSKPHLFISNHRDIAVDPMLVNWTLFHNGYSTLQIAIGDNLLTKPFVSDLMRLNKSFIVNRSASKPREKLKAAKALSAYMYHALKDKNENLWIAHREGRAKNGIDKTNSAVLGMIMLNKPKTQSLTDYVAELNIVPVSISYEYDPCDAAKARELFIQANEGAYKKGEHEDAESIAQGITGYKGHVHLAFGEPLTGEYDSTDDVVEELDHKIISNYVFHPTNCIAYEELHGRLPDDITVSHQKQAYRQADFVEAKQRFHRRLLACDTDYRDNLLNMYANPIISFLSHRK